MPRIEPIPWDEIDRTVRAPLEAGLASGAYTTPVPLQILAYADRVSGDGGGHPNFPGSVLDAKLLELLRIRSAQLGGCAPCMASRKVETVSADDVTCIANPALRSDLTERERRALRFLDLLAGDHHAIADDTYASLAEVFSTAEIVALGITCGRMIGTHRFIHTLDVFGDSPPVIPYDPRQVGVARSEIDAGAAAGPATVDRSQRQEGGT